MTKDSTSDFNVRYTNKDIIQKIESVSEVLSKVHAHVQLTNGRVTELERISLGAWITRNPVKFTFMALTLLAFLISDIRHPIITLLAGFI